MTHEDVELHLVYIPDPTGRVRECCGNCGDLLGATAHIVDARMANGRRVEVHICDLCLTALQEFAAEMDIPVRILDDTPDEAALRKAVE